MTDPALPVTVVDRTTLALTFTNTLAPCGAADCPELHPRQSWAVAIIYPVAGVGFDVVLPPVLHNGTREAAEAAGAAWVVKAPTVVKALALGGKLKGSLR